MCKKIRHWQNKQSQAAGISPIISIFAANKQQSHDEKTINHPMPDLPDGLHRKLPDSCLRRQYRNRRRSVEQLHPRSHHRQARLRMGGHRVGTEQNCRQHGDNLQQRPCGQQDEQSHQQRDTFSLLQPSDRQAADRTGKRAEHLRLQECHLHQHHQGRRV